MIEEAYISFETAKLAKEKRFNEPVCTHYTKTGTIWHCNDKEDFNESSGVYSRPTQSLLARWLRENYGLFVEITIDFMRLIVEDNPTKYYPIYYYKIVNLKNADYTNNKKEFHSYEDAMEAGLQEALKLLP